MWIQSDCLFFISLLQSSFLFFQIWWVSRHSCPRESLVEVRPTCRPHSRSQTVCLQPETRGLRPSPPSSILPVQASSLPWAPPPALCATVLPSNPPRGQSLALTNRIRSARSPTLPARSGNTAAPPPPPFPVVRILISSVKGCSALLASAL